MKFISIFNEKCISIEVQSNRDRLSPFIRNQAIMSDLYNSLFSEIDKTIFCFLKLLNKTNPPFIIDNEFISPEILDLIFKSNFCFIKSKNSSLKRINFIPKNFLQNINTVNCYIIPESLEIHIEEFYKTKVKIKIYLKFRELESLVPINYDFLVPLVDSKKLAFIDSTAKNLLIDLFESITHTKINDDILSIKAMENLNLLDNINIKYLSKSSNTNKNIRFVSNSLFKLNVFTKDNLSQEDTDFYSSIINGYLDNKNYVEYNSSIIILNDSNLIEEIEDKVFLKIISNDINLNSKDFLYKILNIREQNEIRDINTELLKLGFNITLKDYQIHGVAWLLKLYENKIRGGLLADEMGLGKTIQVISFLLLVHPKNCLIVVPASLIHNWKNEIEKFTNFFQDKVSLDINKISTLTIVSYETVRNNIIDLQKYPFDILILDESQKIKNDNTQVFNAVKNLQRFFTIVVTGTPIENSLNDLWSMILTIDYGLLELYSNKIKPLLADCGENSYKKATALTIKIFYPIILQRKKEDVLSLPNQNVKTLLIDFNDKEEIIYQKLIKVFSSALTSGLSGRIQSIALEGLLRLRQYCSLHKTIPNTLINENDIKNANDSKISKTLDIVKNSIQHNEKIIIFSQFTKTLDKLEPILKSFNYSYLRLDGSVSKKKREQFLNLFQHTDDYPVFLISLRAGGFGLNLTSAKNIILLEPWWNPAVEEQAFARIHRIGQLQETTVYRLIYRNSIEEKIDNLLEQKKGIFNEMSSVLINTKSLEMEIIKDVFSI